MTLYVDSSAFARRYLQHERGHDRCVDHMADDPSWATSRVSTVEVARALHGAIAREQAVPLVLDAFQEDLAETVLVDVDQVTLALAREVAIDTGVRTLDAIHLASALRLADDELEFLTYDEQQARAAQRIGLRVA